jgi:lipid A 4'-phosphatase
MIARRAAFFVAGFLLSCGILVLFPQIDVAIAALFWRPGDGFFLGQWPLLRAAHTATRILVFLLAGGAGLAFFAALLRGAQRRAVAAAFLLLSLALGPGLLVNAVFKDHWGRARPAQIAQFGGDRRFSPAFVPSDQCARNCSFPAGDPAVGFCCVSLAFLLPAGARRRRGIGAALALGAALGVARIAQGGHFFSDVVASGFLVFATSWALWQSTVVRPGLSRLRQAVAAPPPALRLYLGMLGATAALGVLAFAFVDRPVARFFQGIDPLLLAVCGAITRVGVSTWWLIGAALVGVACWLLRRPRAAAAAGFIFAAVGISGLIADVAKPVFGRLRPKLFLADQLYGFTWSGAHADHWSFPSGHAVTAAALATAFSLLHPRGWPLYVLAALLVAASRVILDAHYVSDVLGGAALGATVALALWAALPRLSGSPGSPPAGASCSSAPRRRRSG